MAEFTLQEIQAEKERRRQKGSTQPRNILSASEVSQRLRPTRRPIPVSSRFIGPIPPDAVERAHQIGEFARTEVASPVMSGLSTAAGGVPKGLLSEEAREEFFPEQRTRFGKTLRFGSEVAGTVLGVPGKVFSAVNRLKALKGAPKMVKDAAAFGAASAIQTLPEERIDIDNLPKEAKERVLKGVGGAAAGVGFGLAGRATRDLFNLKVRPTQFINKVQKGFHTAKRNALDKFSSQLDGLAKNNPDRFVSLRDVVTRLREETAFNPKLGSAVNRTDTLRRLVENPELANQVTIKETQAIINQFKNKLPRGKFTSDDIPLFDALDDIRGAQLDAFPEMEAVRSAYANVIQRYNLFKLQGKNALEQQAKLFSSASTGFGRNPVLQKAAKDLVGNQLTDEIMGFANATSRLNALQRLAEFGVGGALVFRGVQSATEGAGF